jgi:hypothetical protein
MLWAPEVSRVINFYLFFLDLWQFAILICCDLILDGIVTNMRMKTILHEIHKYLTAL